MSARSLRMTRRRMVAATGLSLGAPLTLAACGATSEEDERSEANDPELLNAVLAQHLAAVEVAQLASDVEPVAADATREFLAARKESTRELNAFIAEREGDATSEPAAPAEAESAVEALALQLQASIEASLEVIGDLSAAAYRQSVHRFITEDAAALAALRSVTGAEVVPDAFVFGAPASNGETG